MRPVAALCHLGLNAICARTGRNGEAERSKTAADALLEELGMRIDAGIEVSALSKAPPAMRSAPRVA
jgi:hypothetical protein